MKNTLKKRLFTNLLINENGIIKKENREWIEIVGSIICVIGILGLMFFALRILC